MSRMNDMLSDLRNDPVVFAEAREVPGGWYVFWETDTAYGFRGMEMTQERAKDLARRLRTGEEKV